MTSWIRRLLALTRRRRLDRELREELTQHLDARARTLVDEGVSPEEARRRASIAIGNVTRLREESREQWGFPTVDSLIQDARYGLRQLRRAPLFAAATTVTLALTIGATTALFALVNAAILRPLPYPGANRLVAITISTERADIRRMDAPTAAVAMREGTRAFQALAAHESGSGNLTGGAQPERVVGATVGAAFFDVLAVRPALGRTFADDELVAGGPPVIVVSHALWERTLGAAHALGDRVVRLDGVDHRVIGVMPRGFRFPGSAEYWKPWVPRGVGTGSVYYTDLVARLRPGVSAAAAREELAALRQAHVDEIPPGARATSINVVGLHKFLRGTLRRPLVLLFAIVGCVLLIACANVANLLLARAAERRRELGVRLALGASGWRLIRQQLVESVMIAALGAVPGMLVAAGSLAIFRRFGPPQLTALAGIDINPAVLLFTLAVTISAGLLFGIGPALAALRVDPRAFLKGTDTARADRRSQPKRLLAVVQLAAAVVLTIGAALLGKSFVRYAHVDRGFDGRQVLVASVTLPRPRYADPAPRRDFSDRVLERLRASPMVVSAAHSNGHLNSLTMTLRLPPHLTASGRASEGQSLAVGFVGGDHFKTFGIRMVAGRECAPAGDGLAAVVSLPMANLFYPGRSALGETIDLSMDGRRTIVGVAADVPRLDTNVGDQPWVYGCISGSDAPRSGTIAVRARDGVPPDAAVALLRDAVRAVDPSLPLTNIRTMSSIVDAAVTSRWFDGALIAVFAAVAVILAAFGVYAVVSYLVAQRTHEIGVRVALGARRTVIVGLVLRQGAVLTAVGAVAGVVAAIPMVRLLRSMLFEVEPLDLTMFAAATLSLVVIGLVATCIPAIRATRVDPIVALRTE